MPNGFQRSAERKPEPFQPKQLANSVIALPLLEMIQKERYLTEQVTGNHPELLQKYDSAIFLRKDFPGGTKKALKAVRQRLAEAVRKLGKQMSVGQMGTDAKGASEGPVIDDPLKVLGRGLAHIAPARLNGGLVRYLKLLDARSEDQAIEQIWPTRFEVIIDINLEFKGLLQPDVAPSTSGPHPDPRRTAQDLLRQYIVDVLAKLGIKDSDQGVDETKTRLTNQYVFARLEGRAIQALVRHDQEAARQFVDQSAPSPAQPPSKGKKRPQSKTLPSSAPDLRGHCTIHHIWPDFPLASCINASISTVKVDAAHRSFTALGKGIVWGVMDSGIASEHPHFRLHANIDPTSPLHADFTSSPDGLAPLRDDFGHGTHVAGIIAGEQRQDKGGSADTMRAVWSELDPNGARVVRNDTLEAISGMAPRCELVSLKVLDEFGQGTASNVIAAIAHVQLINGHGRDLKIHGVNLSLGHSFNPKWFACGHSPLCVEVNRLVKSGVVVVVAAGNTGYGTLTTQEGASESGLDLTINDPGNAECAITVGSTHRTMPHRYGVSYFSSKGPTGDGRCKPDLLAPGEKIISCAAPDSALMRNEAGKQACNYIETSGTSMAAPHVSGAIAAFLSIRNEFIGEAERVKELFMAAATDLGRERYFQGAGLIDLMRALQSL